MTQDGEQLKETEEITSNTLRPTRAAAIQAREQNAKTPFFRNRNFLQAWECRGVSAENWKLARRPGLKARLGYSGKSRKKVIHDCRSGVESKFVYCGEISVAY